MENTIANIRILDVVRLVHGYFIFVFLIINMLYPAISTFAVQICYTNKFLLYSY